MSHLYYDTAKLIVAAEDGELQEISTLLEKGVDVNGTAPRCGRHCTAVWYATKNNEVGALGRLVEAGAELERANECAVHLSHTIASLPR